MSTSSESIINNYKKSPFNLYKDYGFATPYRSLAVSITSLSTSGGLNFYRSLVVKWVLLILPEARLSRGAWRQDETIAKNSRTCHQQIMDALPYYSRLHRKIYGTTSRKILQIYALQTGL